MTAPDLDALEKLADEAMLPMPDRRRSGWFKRQSAFQEAANPATIKTLIAELKEARGLLKGMCDAYEIVCDDSGMRYHLSPTSKYAVSRAFLARNGKGEGQ